MEHDANNSFSQASGQPPLDQPKLAAPAPPPYPPAGFYTPPPPRGSGLMTRVMLSLLIFSVVVNLYLGGIFVAQVMQGSGPQEAVYTDGDETNRIVLLPIDGMIDDTTYQFVRQSLKSLVKKPPKALVLQVNSGGGYVNPSDRIWHELEQFKNQTKGRIPIVASFSAVAASGAYYISATADVIVIEPTGITGSIGVMAQGFTFQELLEKIGVQAEIITSTDSVNKAELHPAQSWTDKDRSVLVDLLNNAYEQFITVVYEGRKAVTYDGKQYGLTKAEVRALATGKVYTAQEALDNQLVDAVGYLDKAIEVAADLGGVPANVQPQVTQLRVPVGLMRQIMGQNQAPAAQAVDSEAIRTWLMELSVPRLAYRLDWR